jgi:ribosomal protein S18 acetylase RimI-like enzyme
MSPLPLLEHAWVVEAMVVSYNHVYKVVHNSKYHDLRSIGISDYGEAPIASFQIEFLAMDDDPKKVVSAIQEYAVDGRKYVVDVFHGTPSARDIKTQYAERGFEFVRTGPILGLNIPAPMLGEVAQIKKIETRIQLDEANKQLSAEGEHIPAESLSDPHIHNFVAKWNGRVAGWVQLVTIFPQVGYINQLYTMTDLRNNRIGTSLVTHVHVYCTNLGLKRMALVSSDMALGVYRRFGYRPLAYFTVFRPKTDNPENA